VITFLNLMTHSGPAIKCVIVAEDWRLEQFSRIRAESWYQLEGAKHGALFASHDTEFYWAFRVSRYNAD